MKRSLLVLFIGLYVVSRVTIAYVGAHPETYKPASGVAGDPLFYQNWAAQVIQGNVGPYSGVKIEYPPGSLPFMFVPQIGAPTGDSYRARFIVLMLGIDVVAMLALWSLARRWGSWLGCWVWLAVIPLLGPITYMRIDLVPAVATLLALERAAARGWFGAGGWLGFGVLAKLYPALFLPAALAVSTRRKALLAGVAIVVALPLIPLFGSLNDLYENVIGYHSNRGIQIESTWSAGILLASRFGYGAQIAYNFGALHVGSSISALAKVFATVLSLGVVAFGTYVAIRRLRRDDGPGLAGVMFAMMTGLLFVGSVFSPQFLLWALALAAAATCARSSKMALPALLLIPVALMTQLIYPVFYVNLLLVEPGAIFLLFARNLLVGAIAALAFIGVFARVSENGDNAALEEPGTAREYEHA